MPEIEIKNPEDIKKLIGWTVKDAVLRGGDVACIDLRMSHPAAEKEMVFRIWPESKVGLNGNFIGVSTLLSMKVLDVED